ncbi:P-loop containing nucleoside triphosphate hydrolase protein [Pluteus cervinus]|uniref:P-loop containing nucleoside triphosphate hydrolase protein n=1 Tax=Pluteus cervinus TaxID=181527 RepID=A0ACD3AHJ1_9AGAR|nr:P-loop containing nucleoside triphosphate hydrolase protein [Pluteus cervinus]
MQRRLSTFVRSSSSKAKAPGDLTLDLGNVIDDGESHVSTIKEKGEKDKEEAVAPLTPPSLKVKRVDYYYSRWTRNWKYRNMSAKVTVEAIPMMQAVSNDMWKEYSIVLVRRLPREENIEPTFRIVVKSEYVLKACKDVIQSWPGISWNTDPLELEPEMFLTFMSRFVEYRDDLAKKVKAASSPSAKLEYPSSSTVATALTPAQQELNLYVLRSTELLLEFLKTDYKSTISQIKNLTSHGEITFSLLYAILVPRSLFVVRCAITGGERVLEMTSWTRTCIDGRPVYQLFCESVDLVDRPNSQTVGVGRVQTTILLPYFKGATRIDSLGAYPIEFHQNEKAFREELLARGKKWVGLIGIHHKQFNGIAGLKIGEKLMRHNVRVNSRIMIDRATFRRLNSNYQFPTPIATQANTNNNNNYGQPPGMFGSVPMSIPLQTQYSDDGHGQHALMPQQTGALIESQIGVQDDTAENVELSDEDLLLASTTVFGFSLSDKVWLQFSVDLIQDVNWNQDAFANLVLPQGRKQLLQSLVEAHHRELGFDDFIKGKGHGLVVNLFGPPGVGKTFSAEATSEHVQRPLYLVGAGDLGTTAATLDHALERVFDVATAWKAIVLIDEADVFLEQRSLHDLERNAMVAVFLRHVEYYRGILFLTTNRVKTFDEAFLSRIHVALHFRELTQESKEQVWRAFIKKVLPSGSDAAVITKEHVAELARRNVNGRQIKNATRTAHSLAVGRGEKLEFRHFAETLDALEEFAADFAADPQGGK